MQGNGRFPRPSSVLTITGANLHCHHAIDDSQRRRGVLAEAHRIGRLEAELRKISRHRLIVIDEVGYIPFGTDAANLLFQLVSTRSEKSSIILTSNLPFCRWGQVSGEATIASAMIDRIVHHAEVIALKGASYRIKHTMIESLPSAEVDR